MVKQSEDMPKTGLLKWDSGVVIAVWERMEGWKKRFHKQSGRRGTIRLRL